MKTLGVWLESGGSADVAGQHLHCHRNTVMNRLHRIEHLTGLELVSPRGLVRLALALHAHRQSTATAVAGGAAKSQTRQLSDATSDSVRRSLPRNLTRADQQGAATDGR